ncbi:hypothetical protein QMZ92_21160 [Streptomyces sp. HNM0645]|uniref:hypothetical protein n=1 Tax=Streptomyces sp. HNM0645 TaxID=2782343 RepID=UPI0024B75248|nr:hypothetical protein [Streptomyces sp. HNM0645]MDI9886810.1 hypothetical protein [Streptomyces sp. HNM0645]
MSTDNQGPYGPPSRPVAAALGTGSVSSPSAHPAPVGPTRSPAGRRRRLLGAVALTAAGTLLGAGVVAWQTDTLPLADSPCWDSVTDQDLNELLGGWETEDAEIQPAWSRKSNVPLHGSCRITSHDGGTPGRQINIRVHKLDGLKKGNIPWAEEFLSSRLTPLGDGLLGMASDTRAWVALPDNCSKSGMFSGPAVVDVTMGDDEIQNTPNADRNATFHKALARTAVHVANATMAELGCSGSLPEPGTLTAVPDFQVMPAGGELCGLKGLRLPKPYAGSDIRLRTSAGEHGPVRTCDIVVGDTIRPQLRLQTIQEQDLTGAVGSAAIHSGPSMRTGASERTGSYSPTIAALRTECPKGDVVFIAQEREAFRNYTFIREVFPAYVAAEAKRLGCGPLEIQIPD